MGMLIYVWQRYFYLSVKTHIPSYCVSLSIYFNRFCVAANLGYAFFGAQLWLCTFLFRSNANAQLMRPEKEKRRTIGDFLFIVCNILFPKDITVLKRLPRGIHQVCAYPK